MKKIMMILALITALGGAAAVVQRVDGRYATAAEVEDVEQKVKELTKEQKRHLINEKMKDIRTRMWNIEDRWSEKYSAQYGEIYDTLKELLAFMTQEARDDYRRLEKEYEELEKELKLLDPPKKVEADDEDS